MSAVSGRSAVRLGALALGVVLFIGALYCLDLATALATVRRLGVTLALAVLLSGLWHLARTWAWAWCFPQPRREAPGKHSEGFAARGRLPEITRPGSPRKPGGLSSAG